MITAKSTIQDAMADDNLDWSHVTEGPLPVVWYDEDRDDPDAIIQAVERGTEFTYLGEKAYHHDTVAGLRFADPDWSFVCGYCEAEVPPTELRTHPDGIACPSCGSAEIGT